MFAKNLEITLVLLCEKGDVSSTPSSDIANRFEALRRYGKLPRGREKRAQPLTNGEIAAAIFGLASANPNWAGHAATILGDLRPVGGLGASFRGASTLQAAVEQILVDDAALKSVVRLTGSGAESGTNSHGSATLTYESGGTRHRTFFVPKEAVSRLQPGVERDFDSEILNSPTSKEMSFNRSFFERIAREVERSRAHPVPPAGDGSEYDAEDARQERYRKLGVGPGSRYLNVGVDNQLTWPQQETLVKFDRYHLVLMPKTRDNVQSIHIDLIANGLTDRKAMTVINRYLSIMTWCDDGFAIAQDGWSGNPIPVAVPKRNLAFMTTHQWIFDRRIPASEEARRALALYREARNAQQNFMVSYAVLNFVKVIEIKHPGKEQVKKWFRDNFEPLKQQAVNSDTFARFAQFCGSEKPHEYIYKACRIAVAHAGKDSKSDPDCAGELTRLHTAAEVLRVFARHFIKAELRISDIIDSDVPRPE